MRVEIGEFRPWDAVTRELLDHVRRQYALAWKGPHGLPHWERVRDIGRILARSTGADVVVVEYFAALHDSRRLNDGDDPEHGARAAEFLRDLSPSLVALSADRLDVLAEACRTHTWGTATDDPTIATCWDADRLDLWRVGIRPNPRYLVTEAAADEDLISWAMERSIQGQAPVPRSHTAG